ncbi:MAG: triosephosphate isomerase, partial [Nitrospina sp.]|nr:triosephosphate isomerase [Nitrospina sp.]
ESFDDQKKGKTYEVLEGQLLAGLKGLNEEQLNSLLIAYEPIWAIGSGHTAGANKVQEVHSFIRNWLKNSFGKNFAERARIIYGGSVDSKISSSLMEQPDVDGLLVGGASLKSKSFYDIIKLSFETGD